MKRRSRASEAERSAKASSICPSMALSAPPRRPISVAAAVGLDAAREVAGADRGRRLLDAPQRAQARGDQPQAEQQRARDHGDRDQRLDPLELSQRRVGLVQRDAEDQRGVGRGHRLRQEAEARAAVVRAHGGSPRAAVARRTEAASGCAASARSRLGASACPGRRRAVRGPDLDVGPGCEHAELGEEVDRRRDAARAWPGPCRSNWSSDPATPLALESSELSTRLKSDERSAA